MRSHVNVSVLALFGLISLLVGSTVNAEAINLIPFNGDSDCGILNTKTYTHKIDFDSVVDPRPATVNTVVFDVLGADYTQKSISSTNFVYEIDADSTRLLTAQVGYRETTTSPVTDDQGIYNLLYEGIYPHGSGGGYTKATLSGLVEGEEYDLRIYMRQYYNSPVYPRTNLVKFDIGNNGSVEDQQSIDEDVVTATGAYYLSYKYTADSSQTMSVSFNFAVDPWILYGLTNEVAGVVPEPSTLALLAAGLVGLIAYAWRKQK